MSLTLTKCTGCGRVYSQRRACPKCGKRRPGESPAETAERRLGYLQTVLGSASGAVSSAFLAKSWYYGTLVSLATMILMEAPRAIREISDSVENAHPDRRRPRRRRRRR